MSNQTMPRVVLESPCGGDVESNKKYARACIRDCLTRGESPIASHLLYTQEGILDDLIPEERALGIAAGHAWTLICDYVVVYIDRGISGGMVQGIEVAVKAKIRVECRSLFWGGEKRDD
jgi:hypothetical protein